MKAVLFLRPDDDPRALRALAEGPIVHVIEARPGKTREALDEVRQAAARGEFQLLAVRTVRFLGIRRFLETLVFLDRCGVRVKSIEEPWLDLSVHGHLIAMLFDMMNSERKTNIAQGVARARAEGRRPGRPKVQVPAELVLRLAAEGRSLREIARHPDVKLGPSTIQRFLAAHRVTQGVAA